MEKLNKTKTLTRRILKIIGWVFLFLIGAFIVLTIARIPHYFKVKKVEDQVYKIHSTKLQMKDVTGENLPKDPGDLTDKTLQGIDSNNNGIRDDVELAIFKEYPNSAKTRAVLLQYALALQMEFTQPFVDEDIATTVMQEKSRSYACVDNILQRDDANTNDMNKYFAESDKLHYFVENNQINTKERIDYDSNFYKYVRSYSDLGSGCDIDLSKLSN